jgi:hypothetical protein
VHGCRWCRPTTLRFTRASEASVGCKREFYGHAPVDDDAPTVTFIKRDEPSHAATLRLCLIDLSRAHKHHLSEAQV